MTGLKEGQRMKYQEDGRVFKITKITPTFVVLQALDNAAQILTGISSLDFLFEKLPPGDFRESRSFRKKTSESFSEIRATEATA